MFAANKARTIKSINLKQYKQHNQLGEKNTYYQSKTKQQTVDNKSYIQQQIPAVNEKNLVKRGNIPLDALRPVAGSNSRSQQQVPHVQVASQVEQKNTPNVHVPYLQDETLNTVTLRGRKFPKPTVMPESLLQTVAAEDMPLVKIGGNGKVAATLSGVALEISTVPEIDGISASESTSDSQDQPLTTKKEKEVVCCRNPALSTIWGMQFEKESVTDHPQDAEGSDAESVSAEQTCNAFNNDERSHRGEASVLDYEFDGSSEFTHDIDANVSDESSIYGNFEDNVLTDYKCYKYCLLDEDGLEIKVHVKILKDLSLDLLHKAGIVPEDNSLLFGIDPCMKLQRVYDHGEDLYVVSENDAELTLKDILSVSGYPEIPPLAKLYITTELIKKFTNLHEKGIYMKNFGSASVQLAKDGRIFVNDFLESALQKLKHQLIAGAEYRETLVWNPLCTDGHRKKDIYRLGQVIGKLLVGSRFQHWLRSGEDIEMMLLAENVPKPILKIICRCLRSREETVCMDEISSLASFFFRSNELSLGRLELQQYLNFKIVAA